MMIEYNFISDLAKIIGIDDINNNNLYFSDLVTEELLKKISQTMH